MAKGYNDKIKASPAIRKLIKTLDIDLADIKPVNKTGRVEIKDIEDYLGKKVEKTKTVTPKKSGADEEFEMISNKIDYFKEVVKPGEVEEEEIIRYENPVEISKEYEEDEIEENKDEILVTYDQTSSSVNVEEPYEERHVDIEDADRIQIMTRDSNIMKEPVEIQIVEDEPVVVKTPSDDRIQLMNREKEIQRFISLGEDIVSKEYDEEAEVITVEDNVINKIIIPNNEYSVVEEQMGEGFIEEENEDHSKRVVITLNDATNNSVIINDIDSHEVIDHETAISELVIETKVHQSSNMGIKANLSLIHEMLESNSTVTHKKVFNTILKAIAFSLNKSGVESFKGNASVFYYSEEKGVVGETVNDINSLTVTQIERSMTKLDEDNPSNYMIVDLASMGIDYYFPPQPVEKVLFVVDIIDDIVKVYFSGSEDFIDYNESVKLLRCLKSVINNPSLMLV